MRNKRNKKDDTINVTDKAFPSLGSTTVSQTRWVGTKTFSNLANNWKIKDEEEARNAEENRQKAIREQSYIPVGMHGLYQRRAEIEYEMTHQENKYDDKFEDVSNQDSEWTEVKSGKKPRNVKTLEHIVEEQDREERERTNTESAWVDDGPDTHETYWDQRY
jgi:hypothetical protein